MTDSFASTNLDSQDDVQGLALSRGDAQVVASIYKLTSEALALLGDKKGAIYWEGFAHGIQAGARY